MRSRVVHCVLFIVHCVLFFVHCVSFFVHCVSFFVHCVLFFVHCVSFFGSKHKPIIEKRNSACGVSSLRKSSFLKSQPQTETGPKKNVFMAKERGPSAIAEGGDKHPKGVVLPPFGTPGSGLRD